MTLRSISVLAIPILLLACGGGESPARSGDPSNGGNDNPAAPSTPSAEAQQILLSQLASASITLNEAIDSAVAANPGSRVLGADLDGTDADVRYEVELALANGSVVEVHIDAKTGGTIATLSEDDADEAGDDTEEEDEDEDEEDDTEEEDEDEDEGGVEDDIDDDIVSECAESISAQEALQIAEATTSGSGVELEVDAEDCEFEVIVRTADGWVEVDVAPDGTVVEVGNDDDDGDDDEADGDEADEDEADDD
jgi:uncharacterized membrane protein YkoI